MPFSYKIGDLAREFNVTLRTLRFYEDKGLINPERSGTTRLYSEHDREQLRIALFCKRIGLSLNEIREVLALNENRTEEADKVIHDIYKDRLSALRSHLVETQQTISELERRVAELERRPH